MDFGRIRIGIGFITFWAAIIVIAIAIFSGIVACIEAGSIGQSAAEALLGRNPNNTCTLAFAAATLGLSGWFLGIAGTLFDWAVLFLVVHLGSFIGSAGPLGDSIALGWTVIRNLVNLAFIGGLIWASISLILGTQAAGTSPSRLVVQILVAAVFVNFSYFFGAAIIDASNFVSKKVYEEGIYSGGEVQSMKNFGFGAAPEVAPISERFMQVTRIGSLYQFRSGEVEIIDSAQPFLLSTFATILFSASAGIFFTAAMFLFIRFVVIIFLLLTSPFGVLYFTGIPVFVAWGKAWWGTLISQAVFPVAFLVLVAISMKILEEGVGAVAGGKTLGGLVTQGGSLEVIYQHLDLVAVFILAWLMLYMSLQVATSIATQQSFTPPSPNALFQGARKFGQTLGSFSPVPLALRALIGQGNVGVVGREFGRSARDTFGPYVGFGRRTETTLEELSERTQQAREKRLRDIIRRGDSATPEEKEEGRKILESMPEGGRAKEYERADGKGKKAIEEMSVYTKPKTAEKPKESGEKKDDKPSGAGGAKPSGGTPLPGNTTTRSATADQRIEAASGGTPAQNVARALETGDQSGLRRSFDQMSYQMRRANFIENAELLELKKNTRMLSDAVGAREFSDHVAALPQARLTPQVIEATVPHLDEGGLRSLLRRRDIADRHDTIKTRALEDNRPVYERVMSSPGGLFS